MFALINISLRKTQTDDIIVCDREKSDGTSGYHGEFIL